MMKTLRVPLVVPGTRPELADTEHRLMAARGRVSLLYQVLLNSAPIAAGWEQLLTAVRQQTLVPAQLRELIILRVAVLNGASFEFDAHVPHAESAGVAAEKIAAVRAANIGPIFSDDERFALQLADAMTRDIVVSDSLMTKLQASYDPRTLVELVTTVAAYNMVSRLLVALNVEH